MIRDFELSCVQKVSQKSPLKILWVSNETKFDDVMALTKLVDIFNEVMHNCIAMCLLKTLDVFLIRKAPTSVV